MADNEMLITYEEVENIISKIADLRKDVENIFDEFGASVNRTNAAGLRGKGGEQFENEFVRLKATFPTFDQALQALSNNYRQSVDSSQALDSNITKAAEAINDRMANIH